MVNDIRRLKWVENSMLRWKSGVTLTNMIRSADLMDCLGINNNNNNNLTFIMCLGNAMQTQKRRSLHIGKRMTSILRHEAEAFPPARQGTILNNYQVIGIAANTSMVLNCAFVTRETQPLEYKHLYSSINVYTSMSFEKPYGFSKLIGRAMKLIGRVQLRFPNEF